MISNTSRKDYFVSNALEMTPHPNKRLTAVLEKPLINRRYKYTVLETSVTGNSATSTSGTALVSVNQGTTDITRTGDRIRLKRIWLGGKVYGNASQTGPVSVRVLVVNWVAPFNAVNVPTAGQVIQASVGYQPYGPYTRDFGDQYQIVYDAVFSVTSLSATQEGELFHLDRELTIDCEFNAGATAPTTNGLFLWVLTDVGANQPAVNFSSTLWFEDLDA